MRQRKIIRAGLLLPVFCFATLSVWSQTEYKYRAAVQKVDSPGFYKISLQPALVAKSETGLRDLRLIDVKGKFTPYITAENIPADNGQKFIAFPEIKPAIKTDTGTTIIIENKAAETISRLWIKLKNTAVARTMNLAGSDDLDHWFAIEEGITLEQSQLSSEGDYVQALIFPASNYHYLKIVVNDRTKIPVKFLSAGVYAGPSPATDIYQPVLPVTVSQQEIGKQSEILISLDDHYQVDKIHLTISGPKYFKRRISVFVSHGIYVLLANQSDLISGDSNDLLMSVRTNHLILHIDNDDNLPLKITGVQIYQKDRYIVSYLEAGQQYYLLTGYAKAEEPAYDLKFFADSIHGHSAAISHLAVTKNPTYSPAVITPKEQYTVVIWVAIGLVLVLLSLLTWKMTAEVNRKTGPG